MPVSALGFVLNQFTKRMRLCNFRLSVRVVHEAYNGQVVAFSRVLLSVGLR